MSLRFYAIGLCLALLCACNSRDSNTTNPAGASPATATSPSTSANTPAANAVKANIDVCGLLTSDDLKSVQGEGYKEALRSDRQDGDFIVAQCYYSLPTTTNSVVLNVTTAKPSGGGTTPHAYWEATFSKYEAEEKSGRKSERERERERAEKKPAGRGEENEEEEGAKPERVTGLGDEAFWLGSRVGGALYVLKQDQFFRISVGGAGDDKAKLSKSKTLAQSVLKKL